MKLVIIFGPPAVGKMTIGQELEKITGLKLFHNHMTIELVAPFFSYSTGTGRRLVKLFREEMFKEVAGSDLEGMIFTYVWYFDEKGDWEYIEEITDIFKQKGADIYYVELEADLEERLHRNVTPHRLLHKPTKRDVVFSEDSMKKASVEHRMNSFPGEVKEKNYIKINNTNLDAKTVAMTIKSEFDL